MSKSDSFMLGIGAGVYETDHAMAGVEMWPLEERVERLDEFIVVAARLLRGEEVTTAGPYYPTRDAIVRPQPIQRPRPPLVVGAFGPRTIRVGSARGRVEHLGRINRDEASAVDAVRRQSALADAACEQEGRDPATLQARSASPLPSIHGHRHERSSGSWGSWRPSRSLSSSCTHRRPTRRTSWSRPCQLQDAGTRGSR